ncbi:hypothetical protein SS50377_26120 [Spironucleus salmonicida]|uniref:Myb-like domain-containing protein n=1 Tax=Spironucleus salmonicida TaxID=348837 RepID=V6LRK3_9EUKA|nr:hypothetical protein SS50377_26120 [Spironucleus salmonicida]|eukprot:EST46326.1 Hypothetical protein SS50377_13637 [Spironucleus salmonicida]
MTKAAWTIFEKEDLVNAVQQYVIQKQQINWVQVQMLFSEYTIQQCKNTYHNCIRRSLVPLPLADSKPQQFSKEKDFIIITPRDNERDVDQEVLRLIQQVFK